MLCTHPYTNTHTHQEFACRLHTTVCACANLPKIVEDAKIRIVCQYLSHRSRHLLLPMCARYMKNSYEESIKGDSSRDVLWAAYVHGKIRSRYARAARVGRKPKSCIRLARIYFILYMLKWKYMHSLFCTHTKDVFPRMAYNSIWIDTEAGHVHTYRHAHIHIHMQSMLVDVQPRAWRHHVCVPLKAMLSILSSGYNNETHTLLLLHVERHAIVAAQASTAMATASSLPIPCWNKPCHTCRLQLSANKSPAMLRSWCFARNFTNNIVMGSIFHGFHTMIREVPRRAMCVKQKILTFNSWGRVLAISFPKTVRRSLTAPCCCDELCQSSETQAKHSMLSLVGSSSKVWFYASWDINKWFWWSKSCMWSIQHQFLREQRAVNPNKQPVVGTFRKGNTWISSVAGSTDDQRMSNSLLHTPNHRGPYLSPLTDSDGFCCAS